MKDESAESSSVQMAAYAATAGLRKQGVSRYSEDAVPYGGGE